MGIPEAISELKKISCELSQTLQFHYEQYEKCCQGAKKDEQGIIIPTEELIYFSGLIRRESSIIESIGRMVSQDKWMDSIVPKERLCQ